MSIFCGRFVVVVDDKRSVIQSILMGADWKQVLKQFDQGIVDELIPHDLMEEWNEILYIIIIYGYLITSVFYILFFSLLKFLFSI